MSPKHPRRHKRNDAHVDGEEPGCGAAQESGTSSPRPVILGNVSDDCPNRHIEHLDGSLECLTDVAPECDHLGRPSRRVTCGTAYAPEPCPYCLGEGLLPSER